MNVAMLTWEDEKNFQTLLDTTFSDVQAKVTRISQKSVACSVL